MSLSTDDNLPGRFFCLGLLLSTLLFIFSCALFEKKPDTRATALIPVTSSKLPLFTDDMTYDGLDHGISQSLSYLARRSQSDVLIFGPDQYRVSDLVKSLTTFQSFLAQRPTAEVLNDFIRHRFNVYRAAGSGKNRRVRYTGYYEPLLSGSKTRSDAYPYPIYAKPKDLVVVDLAQFSDKIYPEKPFHAKRVSGRLAGDTVVPYYDRFEIDRENTLLKNANVLAWVADPVDLFFLHIQGSGKIALSGGDYLNVHYHAANGHPYRSIGKLLIDQGKIPKEAMSMQAIRKYLAAHPEEQADILNYNPSYVFFKPEEDGPIGSIGVKLTPGRSIATDRRLFPPGALTYIRTEKPIVDGNREIARWESFGRFTLNQDTGGAIRGAGRADIFWGNGPYAEIAAGYLQHPGEMYFLVIAP